MKTIATIATTLLLSLGLFISPASAAEPEPTPPGLAVCVEQLTQAVAVADRLSSENALLIVTVATLRDDLATRTEAERRAWAREASATARADRLYVKKIELQHKLTALRAELRALRQH